MNNALDQDYTINADPSGLLDANNTQWNTLLTRLLRNTDRYAWGNWTLDPCIRIGAVGWFNFTDFQFQPALVVLDVPIESENANTNWRVQHGDVTQSTVGVDFKMPYNDPTTGNEVRVGMQSEWSFGTEGSLISEGSTLRLDYVKNPTQYMKDEYEQFLDIAKNNNKAVGDRIDQGFGMITRVWLTTGCVNLGSRKNNSSFKITGSVNGIAAMTGSDESASLKGSYERTQTEDNMEKRIHPSKPNTTTSPPVAYAYEFTSFAGRAILPRWITNVPNLNLWLDNGGSYIVDATVTYFVGDEKFTRTEIVSGGMDKQITGIPLDAVNMDIQLHFRHGASQFKSVQNPLMNWHLGRGHLKLTGWWPGRTGAEWMD
jgi:hypothetical protein